MADSPPVVNAVSNPVARQLRATSLNRALLVLGDWWTVLLLREAFLGVRQFDQFQARLAIPRQTLTNRLRELVAAGLFEPRPYQQRPLRHEYRLTPKGLALYPWALLLWKWQRRWGQQSVNPLPEQLLHRRCGQTMTPVFACSHCRQLAVLRDLAWQERAAAATAAAAPEALPPVRATRHTVSRELLDGEHLYRHGAFIVADRWTHLILGCAYLGVTRFDGFLQALGIAPNILAQRLKVLVDARLFDKRADAQDARRFQYRLTDRSRDLFPISMALVRWADTWLPHPDGPPMQRTHRPCGAAFDGVVLCSACGEELRPHEVSFQPLPQATAAA